MKLISMKEVLYPRKSSLQVPINMTMASKTCLKRKKEEH